MPEARGPYPAVYPLAQTLMAINRRIGMTRAAQQAAIDSIAGCAPNAELLRGTGENLRVDHIGLGDARG